jgi:hypothetical protein
MIDRVFWISSSSSGGGDRDIMMLREMEGLRMCLWAYESLHKWMKSWNEHKIKAESSGKPIFS